VTCLEMENHFPGFVFLVGVSVQSDLQLQENSWVAAFADIYWIVLEEIGIWDKHETIALLQTKPVLIPICSYWSSFDLNESASLRNQALHTYHLNLHFADACTKKNICMPAVCQLHSKIYQPYTIPIPSLYHPSTIPIPSLYHPYTIRIPSLYHPDTIPRPSQ
jgi:hypothetical protein